MPTLPRPHRQNKVISPGSNQRLYNSKQWRSISEAYRKHHPLCEVCESNGLVVAVDVTDHIVPVEKGGAIWLTDNYMGLCHTCHNRKRGYESTGYVCAHTDGVPNNRKDLIAKLTATVVRIDGGKGGQNLYNVS